MTLEEFQNQLTRESNWISEAEVTLLELSYIARDKLTQTQQLMAAKEFNQVVASHEPRIQQVNITGEVFISQAEVVTF